MSDHPENRRVTFSLKTVFHFFAYLGLTLTIFVASDRAYKKGIEESRWDFIRGYQEGMIVGELSGIEWGLSSPDAAREYRERENVTMKWIKKEREARWDAKYGVDPPEDFNQ